ncbi:MAG: hypothetical protein JSW21_09520 [Gammaproteobacteria bacterium]|nr:MAG: hypothetical protein JSW21_09520 [Gammaproteobacteria bacterium]
MSLTLIGLTISLSAAAHCKGKHSPPAPLPNGHEDCSGGGDGDGDSNVATNDITARWDGAVSGTNTPPTSYSPRDCSLNSEPHPQGTHIPYGCVQDQFHAVSVNLTGGEVSGKGSPSGNDATCTGGFVFEANPNAQYIVNPTSGEVCTDGCQLTVLTAIRNQRDSTGYDSVKLTGTGQIPPSTTLNPFACPEDGSPPDTATYDISSVEVAVRDGKGSKADLVCRFDTTSGTNTTQYQVTPVCPD